MIVLKGRRTGGDYIIFTPNGRGLVARSEVGLQIWNELASGAKPKVFSEIYATGYMGFSADSKHLFLDGIVPGLLDVDTGTFTRYVKDKGYHFYCLAADAARAFMVRIPYSGPGSIECWPLTGLFQSGCLWRIALDCTFAGRPQPLPDGRFVLTENVGPTEITSRQYRYVIRSGENGEPQSYGGHLQWYPDRDAVSPCGRWLAALKTNRIGVWSLENLAAPPVEWQNDSRKIFTDLAFTMSGRYLAATSRDETVRFYDTTNWQLVNTLRWGIGKMLGIAFSPDGAIAAAGSDTGRIVIWDLDE